MIPEHRAGSSPYVQRGLKRELHGRHIQLIAIGGCIGTGLFMGSGKTISLAGPAVLLIYVLIGFMLYFVMRAMGEVLLSDLSYKSFADCAEDILGPWAGFTTGWSYWLCWIVTATAEIIAIAGYVSFWWPDLPLWIPALTSVAVLLTLNLLTVRAFGEIEFWAALIKIVAIVALIGGGVFLVVTGFTSPAGHHAAVSNLWTHGGVFPTGTSGVIAGLQTSIFAFVGMEIVGTTAAEAKDPEHVLPRAINTIPLRILLFYVGTLSVLMMVTPWPAIPSENSPFVGLFALMGFAGAASLVNFVVVSSALSSTNSGIYSTSRMLYGLSWHQDAAALFGRLSSRGVPANALLLAAMLLVSAAVLLAVGGSMMQAFQLVGAVASLLFIYVWTIILISYIVFRKRRPQVHDASTFKMPGGAFMPYVVMAFFTFILVTLTSQPEMRLSLYVLPLWFALLAAAYFGKVRRRPGHIERRAVYTAKVSSEKRAAARYVASKK